jgi:hypothetical protein
MRKWYNNSLMMSLLCDETCRRISNACIIYLLHTKLVLDSVWNVMAHAQKQDLVFQWNGRVHLNRAVWRQFSRLLAAVVCASAVVMHILRYSARVLATHCIRLSAKRTNPFKSHGVTSVQSTAGSRGVRISGSNAGYTVFRGSVKGTGYPLHSSVSSFTSLTMRHSVPSHFNCSLWMNATHCTCSLIRLSY